MRRTAAQLLMLLAAACPAASCGKMGPPQPPLRPVPVAVSNFTVERTAGQVSLRLSVPDAHLDGSTPPRVEAVEIYAVTQPASAPAPTAAELAVPPYRIAKIEVRKPDQPVDAANPRPAAGESASFIDKAAGDAPAAAPVIRYYAAAGTIGRRRGPASRILALPLSALREPPADVTVDYTEKELKLIWTASLATDRFIVEEVDSAGANPKRLTAEPVAAAEFTTAVEFGRERCFSLRTVEAGPGVTSIGPASQVRCVTPVDRFAPAAPSNPNAFPGDAAIDILWTASTSPDVAGYIVLRGEGADGTLQPLMTAPVTATQYRDASVRAGVTYSYQIVAVDGATPANRSEPTPRIVVTARRP